MKKFGLTLLGIVAAIILLTNLHSIVTLIISGLFTFAGYYFYKKTDATLLKLFWGSVMLISLLTAIFNIPAFIGLLAIVCIYYVWKKWKSESEQTPVVESNDPFVNFEHQWDELTRGNTQ